MVLQPLNRHYSIRELPWHAFQRMLADELAEQAHDGRPELPLHSWLARALAGSSAAPQRS